MISFLMAFVLDQQNGALKLLLYTMLLHGPMFTNGKNVRNIQSSFSLKFRSFPGKSFSCHKSTGAKQSAYLQHEK